MSRLEAAIESALDERRVVGTVVLVARRGDIVFRAARGFADRETGRNMDEDDVFRLASLTKPILSATALRLVELGRLDLDHHVTDWLPEFRPALSDGSTPPITIRQLLTHTSGLSYGFLQPEDGPYAKHAVSDGADQPGLSMDEELRRIAAAGLRFRPGERWEYSLGLDVLGAVMEACTGASLDDLITEFVCAPLGMTDTRFTVAEHRRERLVTPYADSSPEPVRMPDHGHRVRFNAGPYAGSAGVSFVPARVFDETSFQSGGGGLNGTAREFLRFLEAVRTGGGPILSAATCREMMTNQTGDLLVVNRGPGWGFGLGAAVLLDPERAQTPQSRGTWGWGGVWGHHWFVDPAYELSVVILTNTAVEGMMGRFPIEVRNAVYGNGMIG
jgi:CubicO group peptidase (beta-lactamase class C family)